jgi:hypothetical protein
MRCQAIETRIVIGVAESEVAGGESGRRHPPRVASKRKSRDGGFRMGIIAWIVLGAIAGYLAGFLV